MSDLTKSPMFRGIDTQTVMRLIQNLKKRKFKKNELIIKQGKAALEAYILFKGKVEVFYKSLEGEKTTIIFHKAPFIFGEVELWEERPYLASVQAVENCELFEISKKEYIELLHSSHQLSINMVKLLSDLLWQTGEDRRVRIFGSVDNLLANLICSFAYLHGEEVKSGILIKKGVNKKKMSEILGVSRQSVIRSFGNLEKEELIRIKDKDLIVPDIASLKLKARNL